MTAILVVAGLGRHHWSPGRSNDIRTSYASYGSVLRCQEDVRGVEAAWFFAGPCFRLILGVCIGGVSKVRTACHCISTTTVR